jgi:hypothetical protein
LIHGNGLIKAAISTATALEDLLPSPPIKEMLRKRGIHTEIKPSYPENTVESNRQLQEDEDIPMTEQRPERPVTTKKSTKSRQLKEQAKPDKRILLRINLNRTREQQSIDDVASKR